jgi:hypothetical protein
MPQSNTYLRSLHRTHLALLAVQLVLFALVVFMVARQQLPGADLNTDKKMQVVVLLVSSGALWGAHIIFKKSLHTINAGAISPAQKLFQYRKACIRRWTIITAAIIFCLLCFFLVRNYSFAALALAMMVFYAWQTINKLKLMLQLRLTEDQLAASD